MPEQSGTLGDFLRFCGKEGKTIEQQKNLFTDAEMEIAKETDLPDLLESLGYQVRRIGRYHTTKEMDSLRIKNRRTWFRYSEGVGGDAITFLQRFCGKSFPEAVEYLLAYRVATSSISLASAQGRKLTHSAAAPSPSEPAPQGFTGTPVKARDSPAPQKPAPSRGRDRQKDGPPPPFSLPPPNPDQRRVFAYLQKRGIAPQVIRGFIQAGLLYEDAKYHNCVFVGRDSGGTPVFASKRGTYDLDGSSFKRDVPGSNKHIAFRLPSRPDLDWVLVFEAPIDLMSYLTLHRQVTSNAVALCGVFGGALETYLKDYPHIKQISLCLDADEPGRTAAERLRAQHEAAGYTVKIQTPPRGKDWNECLQQRGSIRERGDQRQTSTR